MIFSPTQKTAFLALLETTPFASLLATQPLLLAALNAPSSIANPTPRPTVPLAYNAVSLIAACSSTTRGSLAGFLGTAGPFIASQDTRYLADGLNALAALGVAITPADASAMIAAMNSTGPDPAWPAIVTGPTPFQSLFPGLAFTLPDGEVHSGTCTAEMLTEAQS